ncbi:MAG TPA: outer membrane beta-barrel protein [Steroidobacteraceae bacterium]|nr:outer membrane beta-barrel protein [Steroidobacteraceae bacterium]
MRHGNPAFAACVLLTLIVSVPAHADDAASLRAELEAVKADYSARMKALEERIAQLETQAAATAAVNEAPPPPEPTPSPPASGGSNPLAAFNPAMSVILSGTYTDLDQDPATYHIAGFIPAGDETGPGERGFSLGESELTLTANVDPYFYGNVTAAITGNNEIAIEEAFFRTTALHDGFTLKGGRFFSGLGYVNEVHAHAWDFVDQPLAYQAFLGGQYAENGLQLKWLAPTDLFLEFGVEGGSGERFPGTRLDANGLNAFVAFTHAGYDIGDSASWRAGLSYMTQRADDRRFDTSDALGTPVVDSFTGSSHLWAADFVYKWAPHGNSTDHYLKIQGEYLHRTESGDLTFDADDLALTDGYHSSQWGAYLQTVYQFRPRWRAGLRYDYLDSGDPTIGLVDSGLVAPGEFPDLLSATPTRLTFMLDWSPSEFSRMRAQYAWDDARDSSRDGQFFLQYLYSLGAHGAHKY